MEESLRWSEAAPVVIEACGDNTILVGGQSINAWSILLNVEISSIDLTADIDFVGSLDDAIRAQRNLSFKSKIYAGDIEDSSVNTAVISIDIPGKKYVKPIDFLQSLYGIDNVKLYKTAIPVSLDGASSFKIIHPVLLMESKLKNIHGLPSKRTSEGISQAVTSIKILNKFIIKLLESDSIDDRKLLNLLETVIHLAINKSSLYCKHEYGLDVMDSIPVNNLLKLQNKKIDLFVNKRLPVAIEQIGTKLRKLKNNRVVL